MKLYILTISLCLFVLQSNAQNKKITKTGEVSFEASIPAFEEVKAISKTTTAIFNKNTGEFAALVLVKGFRFKNALMEEHFNENYAESDTYPKATFKGKILKFTDNIKEINSTYKYSGTIEFHGKKVSLNHKEITISKKESNLMLSGTFKVNTDDFSIKIPRIIKNKLSKIVTISFLFILE